MILNIRIKFMELLFFRPLEGNIIYSNVSGCEILYDHYNIFNSKLIHNTCQKLIKKFKL